MKTAVQVTEAEYEKDKDNVQRIETMIPGVPQPLVSFVQVQFVDDVLGKPADNTETIPLLVPVEKDREEVVIGEDGEPEKNGDGTDKLHVVKYWDFEAREIDLGSASLKKLVTALKPFAEKSRERVVSIPTRSVASKATGPNPQLTEWRRRARKWLQEEAPQSVLRGETVGDKGVLKSHLEEAYISAHPTDPRPGTLGA